MTDVLAGADGGLIAAAQTHFGRSPPFSAELLARWTEPLELVNLESLAGLEHFTGVRQLGLGACKLDSLEALAQMPWLRELKVAASPLTSTRGLLALTGLTSLDLTFTFVTDAGEILAHPTLKRAHLYANPWSGDSYRALSSRFAVSPEREWRLAVAVHEKRLAYGAVPGRGQTLVIPGAGVAYAADFEEVTPEELEAALATPTGSDGYDFLDRFPNHRNKDGSVRRYWTPFAKPGLAPSVLEQIARLGGQVQGPDGAAMDQWYSIKWPTTTFAGTFDWREVWSLQLGVRSDLDEYACKGFVGVGMADGGNYLVLFDVNDPVPTDPAVYYLDHAQFRETRVPRIADRLSEFLAGLRIET